MQLKMKFKTQKHLKIQMIVCLDCWEQGSRDERMEGLQLRVHDTHEVFPSSRKAD